MSKYLNGTANTQPVLRCAVSALDNVASKEGLGKLEGSKVNFYIISKFKFKFFVFK